MKYFIHALTGLLLLTSTLSCKPADQSSDLAVTIGPTPANALPVDIYACSGLGSSSGTTISKPSFEFNFRYQWNNDNSVKVAYIEVDLTSGLLSNGKYQCIITGDELAAVMYPYQNGITDKTAHTSNCTLRCGGLTVSSSVSSAYLPGVVKVVGVQTDADGNSTQVVTETDVAVQYVRP